MQARQKPWRAVSCVVAVGLFVVMAGLLALDAMHAHTFALGPMLSQKKSAPLQAYVSQKAAAAECKAGGACTENAHTHPGEFEGPQDDLPPLPHGGHLVQLRPCQGTNASVPLIVNSPWSGSDTATAAYISQHGAAYDVDKYFTHLYDIVGEDGVLVAPGFFKTSSATAPDSFYQPKLNMAWKGGTSWPGGSDAQRPRHGEYALKDAQCSSYDVLDAILKSFADKGRYPKLERVFLVGHSGGANLLSRYSQVRDEDTEGPLQLRYIHANAANHAYFTDARPWLDTFDCPEAFRWPSQFSNADDTMPRYVKSRFEQTARKLHPSHKSAAAERLTAQKLFERWIQRDVVMLVGNKDTSTSGTQSCPSVAQGGSARRDRNYAFWAMQNLLAHTDTSVSGFFGYGNLTLTGAGADGQWSRSHAIARKQKRRFHRDGFALAKAATSFVHRFCIVDGVGHTPAQMFSSDCGLAALRGGHTLPPDAERYPL